jgi:hypothetical protein
MAEIRILCRRCTGNLQWMGLGILVINQKSNPALLWHFSSAIRWCIFKNEILRYEAGISVLRSKKWNLQLPTYRIRSPDYPKYCAVYRLKGLLNGYNLRLISKQVVVLWPRCDQK